MAEDESTAIDSIMLALFVVGIQVHALRKTYCQASEKYTGLRCDPSCKTKVVHFIRHAEGHHNVAGRNEPLTGYLREDLEDAMLTEEGIRQCKKLCAESVSKVKNAQLLVVSPLNRTMQTATIGFPQLKGKIPWIAVENLRERTGLHPCDRRRSISEHREKYGHVDFSQVLEDKDPLYWKYRLREPNTDVALRAKQFMRWLKERPETEIIVVTHHGYLLDLLGEVIHTPDPKVDATDFRNCEMRTFILQL